MGKAKKFCTLTSPHSQIAEIYVFHAGLHSLVLQDFTSLGMLYLSQCSFPKDHCWFPQNLRAAVCARLFDLAPRAHHWTSVPILPPACSSTISSTSLQPCCHAAAAFLPYRAGSLLGVLGNVLYALGMTAVWLLMNPTLDCFQEAHRRLVPCGSV